MGVGVWSTAMSPLPVSLDITLKKTRGGLPASRQANLKIWYLPRSILGLYLMAHLYSWQILVQICGGGGGILNGWSGLLRLPPRINTDDLLYVWYKNVVFIVIYKSQENKSYVIDNMSSVNTQRLGFGVLDTDTLLEKRIHCLIKVLHFLFYLSVKINFDFFFLFKSKRP